MMKTVMTLCLAAPLVMGSVAFAQTTTAAPATTGQPAAPAQPPQPPARRIEASLAKEAVEAAIAACTAQGLKISAAVVDAGGNPVFVYVPDGVSGRTGDTAIRKGVTMSITKKPASETAALAAADAALEEQLKTNPRLVRFPGGVPLWAGAEFVGAIAGSGATGAQDEACAKTGAEKIAARIK